MSEAPEPVLVQGIPIAFRQQALESCLCLGVRLVGGPPRLVGSGVAVRLAGEVLILTADHVATVLLDQPRTSVTWMPAGSSGFVVPHEVVFLPSLRERCSDLDAALLEAPEALARSARILDIEAQAPVLARNAALFAAEADAEPKTLPLISAGFPNLGKFIGELFPGLGVVGGSCMLLSPEITAWPVPDLATTRMLGRRAPQIMLRGELPSEGEPPGDEARERYLHAALWRAAKSQDDDALGSLSGGPFFWCVHVGVQNDPALILLGIAKEAHWDMDSPATGVYRKIAVSVRDVLLLASMRAANGRKEPRAT
jgi:hypothetical protein